MSANVDQLKHLIEQLQGIVAGADAGAASAAEPAWMPLRDFCRRYGICRKTAYRYIQQGKVEAMKLPSGHWRVRPMDEPQTGPPNGTDGNGTPPPVRPETKPPDLAAALDSLGDWSREEVG